MYTRRKPIGPNNFMELFTLVESKSACVDDVIDTTVPKRTLGILNINRYVDDGFRKVCNVRHSVSGSWRSSWDYSNIDKSIMYDDHRSWVYAIVVGQTIVKIGETGNPLGLKERQQYINYEHQPAANSKSRLGRYRAGDGTDDDIRCNLYDDVVRHQVSIWAKKCPIIETMTLVNGTQVNVKSTIHKSLEHLYLDHIHLHTNSYPRLNKSRS